MAKPIAPTPVLKGQAAIDFIQELSQNKKASEVLSRINDLSYIKSFISKIIVTILLDILLFIISFIILDVN